MALITGTVLWFNASKGFGFLASTGHPDVFCHYSAIESEGYKQLKEGQNVEFEIVIGSQGRPQAANVRVMGATVGHLTKPLTAIAVKPISEYN